jgi:uncharacterized membrane protein YdfJ with MMPL/SSD domain
MSDNITQEPPGEHTAAPDDPWSEFIVRHIPLIAPLALLMILGNFAICFRRLQAGIAHDHELSRR